MKRSQIAEFGDLAVYAGTKANMIVNEEGVLVLISKKGPRVVIPEKSSPKLCAECTEMEMQDTFE